MIPRDEWKWFGHPGHLIVARNCRFRLCTQVGEFLVSTVGEYLPSEIVREINAKSSGVTLEGRGDTREADCLRKLGFEEIGAGRKYETMVFRAGEPCSEPDCNCGLPGLADGLEIDCDGYNHAGHAARGHMAMCEKWADRHYHVNSGDGTDACKECGRDLWDEIHLRADQQGAIA